MSSQLQASIEILPSEWQNNQAVQVKLDGSTVLLETAAKPRQCYSNVLLRELSNALDLIEEDAANRFTHAVCVSNDEHAFNYGGDLNLFVQAIEDQDRDTLYQYGLACIDLVFR